MGNPAAHLVPEESRASVQNLLQRVQRGETVTTETTSRHRRAALDELRDVLTAAIADMRRAIFALRPLDLEALGFLPALTKLVADFGDHNQLAARLELSGPPDSLPASYELPLFRIVQHGLYNIGLHARASSALVRLTVDPAGGVSLSLRDNGRGFDPSLAAAHHSGHFGLRQMRERILDLGGTLDIHSAAGQGTELLVTLPPAAPVGKGVDDASG